jgi:glucokinase-like ROK family protein
MHTGNPELMTKLNQTMILEALRARGPRSRADLAKQLRLSRPTVSRIVGALLEDGLVREVGTGRSSNGGRRPILLEFNHQACVILGIDLRSTVGVGALTDLAGNIIQRSSVPMTSPSAGDGNLTQLMTLIQDLLDSARRRDLKVRGIGIGAPAVTLSEPGIVTWAPSLGWRDLPLKKLVEDRMGVTTFVENDVNLMALGEHWCGAGRGVENLVCISIGTGIGAGIILNGTLYRGTSEAAGEVGCIIPDPSCLGQRYDEFGCLESLASALSMVRQARNALQLGRSSRILELAAGSPDAITAQHIYQAAALGDDLARQIVQKTITYLGIAIANIASILNPQLIILGGDVPQDETLLLAPLRQLLDGIVLSQPQLVLSQLGDAAVLMGAIARALHGTSEYVFVR